MASPPKPMTGTELAARVLVLEAFVIALAKVSAFPTGDLKALAMKNVEGFNRPDLTTNAEIVVDEIIKALDYKEPDK